MAAKTQEINQELNRVKNKIGLVSGTLKINEYDEADENISDKTEEKQS